MAAISREGEMEGIASSATSLYIFLTLNNFWGLGRGRINTIGPSFWRKQMIYSSVQFWFSEWIASVVQLNHCS